MTYAPQFATRGGRRIHWTSYGIGPSLVLLPGLGNGMRLFGTLPRRFARLGRTAIAYDPVGIAPSSSLDVEFDFAAAAQDVWAVIDAAGASTVDLIGTSLGGKVALHVAALAPERVGKLVLLASSAVVSARARRVYRFFEIVAGELPPAAFADAVAPFLFGNTFHGSRTAVVDDIVRALRPDDAVRRLMVAQARALQTFDASALAGQLSMPALCAAGLEDTLTDSGDVRRTAELLAQGSYREFASAGHSLLLEDPAVFDAVAAFLGP